MKPRLETDSSLKLEKIALARQYLKKAELRRRKKTREQLVARKEQESKQKKEKPLGQGGFQSAGKMSVKKDDGLNKDFVGDNSANNQHESSESSKSALDQ